MSKMISGKYLLYDYDANLIYNDFIFVNLSASSLNLTKFEITTNFNNTR